MPLGKPAVLAPSTLDLRAIRAAVTAIRERLQFIEQAISAVSALPSANAAASAISTLQFQLAQLTARVTNLESQVDTTDVTNLVAATAVAAGDLIIAEGVSSCAVADITDPLAVHAVIGLAQTAAAVGQTVAVQRSGSFSFSSASFDVGRAVYLGVGGLTQYPEYTDAVVMVGVATTATTLWVAPAGQPVLRTPGFDPGYEKFMPASYGLVADAVALLASFNDQPDGILVKVGENLVATRTLVAGSGSGITIEDNDGVLGDPRFEIHLGE